MKGMNQITKKLYKQMITSPYHLAILYDISTSPEPETALRGYLSDVLRAGGMETAMLHRVLDRVQLGLIIKAFRSHNDEGMENG
jgi:hypothetical protein